MKKPFIVIFCLIALLIYACKHEAISISKAPKNLVYLPDSASEVSGIAGSSVMPSLDNISADINFTIVNTANQGISINSTTGVISWISTVATGTYNLIVTASNSYGKVSTNFVLKITVPPLQAPSNLLYSPASANVVFGNAGNSVTPALNTGTGGNAVYSLTGTVPNGISINATSGVISWSKTVSPGTYALSVIATNTSGITTTSYTLTVTNAATVTAPTSFSYSPAAVTITQGTAGSSAIPTINNGLGTISYALTGTIPAGISINATTGVISWSTAVVVGTYTINVSATNSAGKTTATYSLTVNAVSATVSFSASILPILKTNCSSCHSYTSSYSGISSHTSGCNSIQNKIGTTYCSGSRMPQGSSALSASFIATFNAWIAQGMPNN